jgi:hypothetical protein
MKSTKIYLKKKIITKIKKEKKEKKVSKILLIDIVIHSVMGGG